MYICFVCYLFFFFFQAEDGIRDKLVTGVQTCALPISLSTGAIRASRRIVDPVGAYRMAFAARFCIACSSRSRSADTVRSEEHTSELQSLAYLVCRLLLEKKKKKYTPRRSA